MKKAQRDKLVELKKKKAEAESTKHQQLLESDASIKEAILALNETINSQQTYDDSKLIEQLKELKESQTFSKDITRLETALKNSTDKQKLNQILEAVGDKKNIEVVNAVNALITKLDENTLDQSPESYQPYRRVIKLAGKFIFDDKPTPTNIGGSSGSGVNISTLAKEEKQDTQIAELEKIRGFDIPPYDEIDLGYTGDNLTTVTYSLNGSTVATLTLSYTGANLTNVVIS